MEMLPFYMIFTETIRLDFAKTAAVVGGARDANLWNRH